MKQSLRDEYRATLKSMDTEETLDLMFYRPLGFAWAKLFAKLGVKPNAVTIASIFLGVAGGVLLYYAQPELRWLNYVGMLLIVWANSYDSADGQLARMTGQYSRIGRILDGLSGDFWFVTIYVALALREATFGDFWPGDFFINHAWVIWTMAILSGLSHTKQAASADYYRQFHLYILKGKNGSELDSAAQIRENYRNLPWKGNVWKKLTMFFYGLYTAGQEGNTPAMQRLRKAMHDNYGEELPQSLRDAFRSRSLPLMKYTNMLTFNTRIIAMFITVIINMPWLYFVIDIVVFNLMMIYMIVRHERACRITLAELERGDYPPTNASETRS